MDTVDGADDRLPMRSHGFELPLHPLQVISWIIFGIDLFAFCFICLSLLDGVKLQAISAVLYGGSAVVLVSSTVKATKCNPADPHIFEQEELKETGLQVAEEKGLPYCTICEIPVVSRSKHCKICNKCVDIFDHHCIWLNNCVGAANYRAFAVVISSLGSMTVLILGTCTYLLLDLAEHPEDFDRRLVEIAWLTWLSSDDAFWLLLGLLIFNVPLLLLDAQLLILHAFLASQDMTTFEYITNKRSLQKESGEGNSETKGADEATTAPPKAGGDASKALPSALDWIVFARCGCSKRKGKTKKVHSIEDSQEQQAVSGTRANADGSPWTASGTATSSSPETLIADGWPVDHSGFHKQAPAGSGPALTGIVGVPRPEGAGASAEAPCFACGDIGCGLCQAGKVRREGLPSDKAIAASAGELSRALEEAEAAVETRCLAAPAGSNAFVETTPGQVRAS
eukprot:TRINITY_DN49182_c0_g1_i1.p1 TRINITY_DN49182_c0_g1~~TRINITY_DN49182_c0_g1_i1.p1  ORF type:complete len:454 (+),score=103.50 TRINITY_DN49182_c0_g1_i1:82-1443(+)